jgi:hypothetical protein
MRCGNMQQLHNQQECALTDKIRCYATSITEGDIQVVLPPGLATRHLWLLLYPCGTSTGTTT